MLFLAEITSVFAGCHSKPRLSAGIQTSRSPSGLSIHPSESLPGNRGFRHGIRCRSSTNDSLNGGDMGRSDQRRLNLVRQHTTCLALDRSIWFRLSKTAQYGVRYDSNVTDLLRRSVRWTSPVLYPCVHTKHCIDHTFVCHELPLGFGNTIVLSSNHVRRQSFSSLRGPVYQAPLHPARTTPRGRSRTPRGSS
jgi:hypothetical protein